jgi:hypothetical protein
MTKTAPKPAIQRGEDAITLLTEDHKKVKKLFADFAKLAKGDGSDKAKAEKEEEEKMFPKAKKAKVDTAALGAALIQRKYELQAKPSHRSRPGRPNRVECCQHGILLRLPCGYVNPSADTTKVVAVARGGMKSVKNEI